MDSGQKRALRARPACALLPAVGVACGDATGPLRPADVVGTYTLQVVRGHGLPWADTSATDSPRSQIIMYAGQLTLRADSVVVNAEVTGTRTDPRPRADADSTGRWALDLASAPASGPHTLRLSYYLPGDPGDPRTGRPERPTQSFSLDYVVDAGGRRIHSVGREPHALVWVR